MRAWHGLIVLVLAICASEAQAAPQVGGGEGYTCAMGPNGYMRVPNGDRVKKLLGTSVTTVHP